MPFGGALALDGVGCCDSNCSSWSLCFGVDCCSTTQSFGYLTSIPQVGNFSARFHGPNGEDQTVSSIVTTQNITATASIIVTGSSSLLALTGNKGTNYSPPPSPQPGYQWSGGVQNGQTPTSYPTVTFTIGTSYYNVGQIIGITLNNPGTGWTVAPTLTIDPPPPTVRETYSVCLQNPAPGSWTVTPSKTDWTFIPASQTLSVVQCQDQAFSWDAHPSTLPFSIRTAPNCCLNPNTSITLTDPDGKTYTANLTTISDPTTSLGVDFTVTCPAAGLGQWTLTWNPSDPGCLSQSSTFNWCFCQGITGNVPDLLDEAHYYCCHCSSGDPPSGVYPKVSPRTLHYSDPEGAIDVPTDLTVTNYSYLCEWITLNYIGDTDHAATAYTTLPDSTVCVNVGPGTYSAQIEISCTGVDPDGTAHYKVTKSLTVYVHSNDPSIFCGSTTGADRYILDRSFNPTPITGYIPCTLIRTGYASCNIADRPNINLSGDFTEFSYDQYCQWYSDINVLPEDNGGPFTITGS